MQRYGLVYLRGSVFSLRKVNLVITDITQTAKVRTVFISHGQLNIKMLLKPKRRYGGTTLRPAPELEFRPYENLFRQDAKNTRNESADSL